jgi:hypothetical protein
VHAPQVALFFAPLGTLPYEDALAVFLVISVVVYGLCCRKLWVAASLSGWGWTAFALALGFPPFYALLASGQTSVFALAWFTAGYLALRAGRPLLAGLALGMLAYKPTLLIAAGCVWLLTGQIRVIAGAALAAAVQFGLALAWFGSAAIAGYFENFRRVAGALTLLESQPQLMHSLSSFFSILLPWPAVAAGAYAVTAAIVLALAVRAWRSSAPLDLRFSVLLLATILVNPHAYSYELVVLVPVFVLVSAWALAAHAKWWIWLLLYLSFYLPAFDAFTSTSRVQVSVIAMCGLLLALSSRK